MASTHIFCPECGNKNDFANGRRPNFCSGCGYNFASLAAFGGSPAQQPARPASPTGLDIEIDTSPQGNGRNATGGGGRQDDAGFSMADIQIEGGNTAKIVNGSVSGVTRVHDTSRPTVGQFWEHSKANPMPPEMARHPTNIKIKGAKNNAKDAFASYKDQAGGNGLKRQEVGGNGD